MSYECDIQNSFREFSQVPDAYPLNDLDVLRELDGIRISRQELLCPNDPLQVYRGAIYIFERDFVWDSKTAPKAPHREFMCSGIYAPTDGFEINEVAYPPIKFAPSQDIPLNRGVPLHLGEEYIFHPYQDITSSTFPDPLVLNVAVHWPGLQHDLMATFMLPTTRAEVFRKISSLVKQFIYTHQPHDPYLAQFGRYARVVFEDVTLQELRYYNDRYNARLNIEYPKERWELFAPDERETKANRELWEEVMLGKVVLAPEVQVVIQEPMECSQDDFSSEDSEDSTDSDSDESMICVI